MFKNKFIWDFVNDQDYILFLYNVKWQVVITWTMKVLLFNVLEITTKAITMKGGITLYVMH